MKSIFKGRSPRATRIQLFTIWSLSFLVYALSLLSCARKADVSPQAATEATWQLSYLFVPILSAFLGRILSSGYKEQVTKKIDAEQRYVLFGATLIAHSIIAFQLYAFVVFRDFSDMDNPGSFMNSTSALTKTILVLWTLCVAPVEFVLGKAESISPQQNP